MAQSIRKKKNSGLCNNTTSGGVCNLLVDSSTVARMKEGWIEWYLPLLLATASSTVPSPVWPTLVTTTSSSLSTTPRFTTSAITSPTSLSLSPCGTPYEALVSMTLHPISIALLSAFLKVAAEGSLVPTR